METISTMGSGSFGRELSLEVLVSEIQASLGQSVDANFTSDSIVTFRLDEDGPAYTVYRTGTFQVRGAKSKEKLKAAEDAFLDVLDGIGVDVEEYEFEHVTSVFMTDLEQDMNLTTLAVSLGLETVEYEPEQFPGLVCRPDNFECVLLVFGSGKVVITGGRNKSAAKRALDWLVAQIDRPQKN